MDHVQEFAALKQKYNVLIVQLSDFTKDIDSAVGMLESKTQPVQDADIEQIAGEFQRIKNASRGIGSAVDSMRGLNSGADFSGVNDSGALVQAEVVAAPVAPAVVVPEVVGASPVVPSPVPAPVDASIPVANATIGDSKSGSVTEKPSP